MPSPSASSPATPLRRLFDQPYLLLSLTALAWAGNIVVGRYIAGQIPPGMLSLIRWAGALVLLLPLAWPHLQRDWPTIRGSLGLMIVLSLTGITIFNTLSYWALEYTQALNGLLLQSSSPLYVALWSLVLLRVRLTAGQAFGVVLSTIGVFVIVLRGDLTALAEIELNKGDVIYVIAFCIFGFYSTLMVKRPAVHTLSFLAFTFGCGALGLVPFVIWEIASGRLMAINTATLLSCLYVVTLPSTVAYLFFDRGIQLIGANRAAPFMHLIPVFGSVMAIGLLGESMHLYHLVGYAMVLTGIFVAARGPIRKPPPVTPA